MITNRDRNIMIFLEQVKAITIKQASDIFFGGSYESARRRLNQLENVYNKLKSYKMNETDEKVYYLENKITYHDSLVISFIAKIKSLGGEFIQNTLKPKYLNGKIIPDLFSIFKLNGYVYFILLEVDLYHDTPLSKMKLYEELYKSKEIQNENQNQFPIIIISKSLYDSSLRYNSENFNTIYTDKHYNNIDRFLESL